MDVTIMPTKARYPVLRGSLANIKYPAWAEIKVDGEYNKLIKNVGEDSFLLNKYGKKRTNFKVTKHVDKMMEGHHSYVILGELIYGRGQLGDLYKLIQNKHGDGECLDFYPFDIAMLDGVDLKNKSWITRAEIIDSKCNCCRHRFNNNGKLVNSIVEVEEYFNEARANGYEGIVVKHLHEPLLYGPCSWVKMKGKDTNEYVVSQIDPVRERVEIGVVSPSVSLRTVGVKVSSKDKATLQVGCRIKVEHQGILAHGGLRHPVFKGKV